MTQQDQKAERVISVGHSLSTPITVDTATPLPSWLNDQLRAHKIDFQWLLLHAESGVVWGERQGDTLAFSVPAASLSWNTLLRARLFGEQGELFVWQGPQGWQARLIADGEGQAAEWIDEPQVLWGNRADHSSSAEPGFTPITEGSQGITHAPPIGDSMPVYHERNSKGQSVTDRARLLLRHYINEDDAGVARVSYSRLVRFVKPREK